MRFGSGCSKLGGDRFRIAKDKGVCLKCLSPNHRAKDCKSKVKCSQCHEGHSALICKKKQHMVYMMKDGAGEFPQPLVHINVKGVNCVTLVDTGASLNLISPQMVKQLDATTEEGSWVIATISQTEMSIRVYNAYVNICGAYVNLQFAVLSNQNGIILGRPSISAAWLYISPEMKVFRFLASIISMCTIAKDTLHVCSRLSLWSSPIVSILMVISFWYKRSLVCITKSFFLVSVCPLYGNSDIWSDSNTVSKLWPETRKI